MSIKKITIIHSLFQDIYKMPYNKNEVENKLSSFSNNAIVSPDDFLNNMLETGSLLHLAYFKNWMSKDELDFQLKQLSFPVLVFKISGINYYPVILSKEKNDTYAYTINEGSYTKELYEVNNSEDIVSGSLFSSYDQHQDKILVVTCFPVNEVGQNILDSESKPVKLTTIQRFIAILKSEKREIGYVYIYAIISGIIGLSLPLGIQSIIGFISSGQITTSVVVLISFIIIGIIITGCLQVIQLSIVEHIQQRLFAKTAFEFAFRIPKIHIESVLKTYPPELMNRFFDIVTLQKGLAKILLEFTASLLQVLLGLILLSFYHSSFIFFGIFLVVILILILKYTGSQGLKTSLKESKYKYMVANWLEEIARSLSTFKLAGYSNLPMEKADYYVSNYLHARKKHFKVLVTQYLSFVAFKTLITGGLLILGCLLLIDKQINIGQFIASEIIIILIMNAVEKIIIHLDTVYDVLTSIEKIGSVTDLPIEMPKGINIDRSLNENGISFKIKNLKYKYPSEPDYILKGINIEVNPSERICLIGYSSSGKTTFINIILGLLTSYEGIVTFNNIPLKNINKNSLINITGDNISQEDLFDGTLMENITLGRNIKLQEVIWALECVGLSEFIQTQTEGLYTRLISGRTGISESVARKIIVARSIVMKPKLLILEDTLLGLEKENKLKLMNLLTGKEYPWTLILVSNDEEVMKICDRTIILREGKIVADGAYEVIIKDIHFKELV